MAALIPAGIGAATSLFSGITGKKSAKKAQAAQTAAIDAAVGEQRRQYDTTRADFAPFLGAGTEALGGVEDLLGLNGEEALKAAIESLKGSPSFTSLYDTGVDTLLQNSAATGELRGGDTKHSLAQFGSNLLATVIQNRLQGLGGLVNIGSGAAGQLGANGQSSADSISNLFTQKGNVAANGIGTRFGMLNNTLGAGASGLTSILSTLFGGRGF